MPGPDTRLFFRLGATTSKIMINTTRKYQAIVATMLAFYSNLVLLRAFSDATLEVEVSGVLCCPRKSSGVGLPELWDTMPRGDIFFLSFIPFILS